MKMLRTKTLEGILENPKWYVTHERYGIILRSKNNIWCYTLNGQTFLNRLVPLQSTNRPEVPYKIDNTYIHEDLVEEIFFNDMVEVI